MPKLMPAKQDDPRRREIIQRQLGNAADLFNLYELKVDERLPKALSSDRAESLSLIAMAAGLLKTSLPIPPKLADWLSLGLEGLSAGLSPEESFGFAKRGRGRTSKTALAAYNAASRRAFLVEYLAQDAGMTIESSCAMVAEMEHVDAETVNAAWDKNHLRAKTTLAVSRGAMRLDDLVWVPDTPK